MTSQELEKAAKQLERLKELKDDPDALWPPAAAAVFLGVTVNCLASWRTRGGGPVYTKVSPIRVAYRKADLVEFARSRRAQSTSAESLGLSAPPLPEDAK